VILISYLVTAQTRPMQFYKIATAIESRSTTQISNMRLYIQNEGLKKVKEASDPFCTLIQKKTPGQ
jgi:hypothetical protein